MPTEATINGQTVTGIDIINEVATLDAGIPLTDDTKMYIDIEKSFRQIPLSRLFDWLKGKITKLVYPVGSIYMTLSEDDPTAIFGGAWEKIEGKFLLGSSENFIAGTTGGEESHVLTNAELPSHTHTGAATSNGSHTHTISVNDSGSHNHTPTLSNYLFTLNKNVNDGSGVAITGRRRMQTNTGNIWAMSSTEMEAINQCQTTSTNGSHNHTANAASTGDHTHNVTITATGSGEAHNNMPPYQSVNIWKRVS